MSLPSPFKLERYFAKWEFSAPHLLCCSDCEPLSMADLLAMAANDEQLMAMWKDLRLGYTETRGLPALRAEIASLYDQVGPDQVLVCAPEEGIYLTMRALLRPGDHVVATFPGYQSLYDLAGSIGASVSRAEPVLGPGASLEWDVERITSLIKPHTRMVVINFPHNPTGTTLTRAQWSTLLAAVEAVGAYLFSDEMYRLLELDPAQRLPSAADCYPRAVSLSGMSKSFSLPGLRLGWLTCQDAGVLDAVATLKDYTTICSPAPSEVLALMALRSRARIVDDNLELIHTNLRAVRAFMTEFSGHFEWAEPAASSVAFPRLVTGEPIEAFCSRVVEGCGVLLLPASVYDHAPCIERGHFRIGLGRRDLPECLGKLAEWLRAPKAAPA